MATTSEVKSGLDQIATRMAAAKAQVTQAVSSASSASTDLGSLAGDFSDVISTINGYTPTGEFESLAQDELAKLTTEFQALKAIADAIVSEGP